MPPSKKLFCGPSKPEPGYAGFRRLFSEQRAQGEWNSVYLLIVFAIAAILIIALIKPMFKQSQDIVSQQPVVGGK